MRKSKWLGLIAAGALSLTAIALCSMQPVSVFAETVESKFIIQEGASVRLATDAETQEGKAVNGIRFAAYITETYYENLTQTEYPTATEIVLQSTVSKVVEESETAPSPFTFSWDLKEPIVFNEKGIATFYHTLNFSSLTGENLKAANAFDMEADFWIEVKTESAAEPIKIEADNAAEVETVRSMRQVAYAAYTIEGTDEKPNRAFEDERLKNYFTLGASTEAAYDMDVATKAILKTAPENVVVDKVYVVNEENSTFTDVTDKTLATDTGVFTAEDANAGAIKTIVYFDENNVAYTTTTRYVTKIVDTVEELTTILTTANTNFGYNLLTKDLEVTGLTNSAVRNLQNGTFDGNGHKITATTATTATNGRNYRYGFFGHTATGLTVKNMQIEFTKTFSDSTEWNTILAYTGACTFENIDLQIHAGNDTKITASTNYLPIMATKDQATAKNVVVRVDSNVIASGKQLVGVGFKENTPPYVFYSGDWKFTSGVEFGTRYTDVAAAVDAGQKFANLTATGYWTLDEANKTLTFGKTAYWATINALSNALIAKLQEQGIRNISFLGDSITTFEGWSNNTSYNSTIGDNAVYYTASKSSVNVVWWKQVLDMTSTNLCVNNSYSGDWVTNRGVSRSLQLHRDGDEIVNPDMIFVYLGVNDFNHSVDVQTFKETYDTMIKGMLEKYTGVKIYVGTIMPNARRVAPTVLDQFNAVIREIAEKYNVGLIDFYNDSGVTADNMATYYLETTASQRLHPNALGMDMMTQTVLNKLIKDYIG